MKENNSDAQFNKISYRINKLFDENKYKEILEIVNSYPDIDFLDRIHENYGELAEIISVCYLELKKYSKALSIINEYIIYLTEIVDDINTKKDDLTNFFLLKIEIYERTHSHIKQYKTMMNYINLGGCDSLVLDWKSDTEEKLFNIYVFLTKSVLYIVTFITIISLFNSKSFTNPTLYVFNIVWVIWYSLNFFFHKRIKNQFVHILNNLFSK